VVKTRKELKEMKTRAQALTGVEYSRAMLEYHDEERNYWDSAWGNSLTHDDERCHREFSKHEKMMDKFEKEIRRWHQAVR